MLKEPEVTDLILEMKSIIKNFPGVQALQDVDLSIKKGEIHALVGQNGAGKSTLLKILSGFYHMDSGKVTLNGKDLRRWTPQQMIDWGVSFIYQELNLVQSLSVAQNIYIGREPKNPIGLINWNTMRAGAVEALARIGVTDLDVNTPVNQLTVAKQQLVAIARVLDMDPTVLILDEPTSRLGLEDAERLFEILKDMQEKGLSIIYVTHRLSNIYRLSDRITVLRDGKLIISADTNDLPASELVKHMVGQEVVDRSYGSKKDTEKVLLQVSGLFGNGVNGFDLQLHTSEVVGLLGAVGAGKTESVRLIFGIDPIDEGYIQVCGTEMENHTPTNAISAGMALCPEDRKYQGLLLENSISENVTLAGLKKFATWNLFPNKKKEKSIVFELVNRLRITTPKISTHARSLSGGNQQKVVLAKWLCTDSKVFLFDEPTIGVDVQGKAEIYQLLHELSDQGAGVLFVTSDIEEGLQVCDRVLVMFKGQIVAELDPRETNKEEASLYAMGGSPDELH